jgi:hypothetical protein
VITVRFVAQVEYEAQVSDEDAALAVWQMRAVARDVASRIDDLEKRGYRRVRRRIESGHAFEQSPVRAWRMPRVRRSA